MFNKDQKEEGDKNKVLKCATCLTEEGEKKQDGNMASLKLCSRCKKVYYCSRECQK